MKDLYRIIAAFLLVVLVPSVNAEIFNGGPGLTHTKAAWAQKKGYLTVFPNTRFWGKVTETPATETTEKRAYTVWDVQGLVSVNYGINEHFGFYMLPIMYQDLNQGDKDEIFWDTFIGIKAGSYKFADSPFQFGVELAMRFPTGSKHNVIYEDYTAGTVEWGFNGLVSWAKDKSYPDEDLNAHFNFGYWNHNDVGETLVPDSLLVGSYANLKPYANVLDPSQELRYALGLEYPTANFNYGLEIYGNGWLQKPPVTAASHEYYSYMNLSITYKPNKWFNFVVSGDIRISPDEEETIGPRMTRPDLPNYSSWKINVGGRFVILPTSVYKVKERDILMKKAESRREVFEQIIKEKKETESAEQELQRIKDEREKAEKELERLKRILEGKEEVVPTNPDEPKP
ncbi:MAG TPA: hypothetical protein PLP19_12395 [bacterium]|nr:hypothetical protein [bacterium]HPN44284.1 hypothetical protein [bacterium]